MPRDDATTILDVDSCDTGIGAINKPTHSWRGETTSFRFKNSESSRKKLLINRREALALIHGLNVFSKHCLGRDIIIRTDNAPLITIQSTPNPSAEICRY